MLEVSRGAVAAAEEANLVSCTAKQSAYCPICTVTLGPCGDLPFTILGRWQCLRVGADGGLNSRYAVCGCGTEYRFGALPDGDVWRHARGDGAHCPFAAQRGDGAHCPSHEWYHFTRPKLPGLNSRERFFGRRFEVVLGSPSRFKKWIGLCYFRQLGARDHRKVTKSHNFTFSVQGGVVPSKPTLANRNSRISKS